VPGDIGSQTRPTAGLLVLHYTDDMLSKREVLNNHKTSNLISGPLAGEKANSSPCHASAPILKKQKEGL
jgi:hypothetical protein